MEGINEIKNKVDTLIVVPNQRLLDVIDRNISFMEALKKVDDVLAQAVKSISQLITQAGLINVDFADVRSVMLNAGTALMGMGSATGEDRATQAAKTAMSSPLLEMSINGATGVLFNVIGGKDLAMYEVDEAAKMISDSVHPDANIIFGATIDPDLSDELQITVLATGFDTGSGGNPVPQTGGAGIPPRPTLGQTNSSSAQDDSSSSASASVNDGDDDDNSPTANFSESDDDLETPSFLRRKKDF